jgi:hypothetical protein
MMRNPFSRRRAPEPPPPPAHPPQASAAEARERYEGRPLMLLLEHYVPGAIGQLPSERSAMAGAMVQKMWGGGDDWMQTLRSELDVEASLDEELRALWSRNQAIAAENGVKLHPVHFARMVVDENFAHLLNPPPG